jgi:RNA polymerase sigma-70 factor (ECF subfamily)
MTEPTDEILVTRALEGDPACFATLCQRYYPALVAIAHAIAGDGHLAEDAAQEAIAEACRRLRTLRKPQRFGSWLGAICRNIAKDMLTDRSRSRQVAEGLAAPAEHSDGDEKAALTRAVRALPESLRQVVLLRYYNAMTYEQMSSVLGLSSQAINGRLRRARKRIASTMKANGFGDSDL